MAPDDLSVAEVESTLRESVVIEDYPQTHRYLPDCLVLMYGANRQPIHAVVALNGTQEYILIVTVYRPNPKEWESDWRTRK